MNGSDPFELRVVFHGRVQGVGFRYSTQSVARDFEVSGYVRNLPDGTVECVAAGTEAEVTAFVAKVAEVMARNIDRLERSRRAATTQYNGFQIRR